MHMTREEIQEVLTNSQSGYIWLGYSRFHNKENPTFTCERVEAFNSDTGVLTYDGGRDLTLDQIIFAKSIDPDVWTAIHSRKDKDLSCFTLKGTMMSECGEITITGQITRLDQTRGTVHFESDFMLSDITELIAHHKGDDEAGAPI